MQFSEVCAAVAKALADALDREPTQEEILIMAELIMMGIEGANDGE